MVLGALCGQIGFLPQDQQSGACAALKQASRGLPDEAAVLAQLDEHMYQLRAMKAGNEFIVFKSR